MLASLYCFLPTRDMLNNVKTSLTPGETAQVVLVLVVTNRGDEVSHVKLTVAETPPYVSAVTFLTVSTQWCVMHNTAWCGTGVV